MWRFNREKRTVIRLAMGCGRSTEGGGPGSLLKVNKAKSDAKHIKVVLLGNSGVGKSSVVDQYINRRHNDTPEATVGVGYYHHKMKLPSGSVADLDIWDTGGQERYRALLPLYYREAAVAIIIYDVSNYPSFEACEYWYRELKRSEPDCLLFLVGNKTDIPTKRVDSDFARDYAKGRHMLWTEASAKTGQGITELFSLIATTLAARQEAVI